MSASGRSGRGRAKVSLSACVVGILIMGDSFLYSALPVSADSLSLTLWQVGLLLSANRWVRLLSNSVAATLFSRWRIKPLFVGATILALASSLAFAQAWSFPYLLVARLAWGFAWSIFRQSAYMAVWTHSAETHGGLLGIWWGLVRLGSGMGVLLGGWLLDRTRFATSMGVISALAGIGFALSFLLTWPKSSVSSIQKPADKPAGHKEAAKSIWQSSHLKWLFSLGAGSTLILALLVALTSLYLQERGGAILQTLGIGLATGLILALHWISQIVVGPVIGAFSDRFGRTRITMALAIILASAIGLAATAHGTTALVLAALFMLFFSGLRIVIEAGASDGARLTTSPREVMGYFTSVDDLAAACGPLIGLVWFQSGDLTYLLWGSAGLLLFLSIGLARSDSALHSGGAVT